MSADTQPGALDLAPIKARAEAATPGPWKDDGEIIGPGFGIAQTWDKHEDDFANAEANSEFIAHARQDIPALVAEVERLRAVISDREAARDAMEDLSLKLREGLLRALRHIPKTSGEPSDEVIQDMEFILSLVGSQE